MESRVQIEEWAKKHPHQATRKERGNHRRLPVFASLVGMSGTLREESYTFFWQGKPHEEPRQHGVGFAVKNTLVTSIEPPSAGTERILNLRLSTSTGPATIVSVYAPTLCAAPEDKDQFFEALDEAISRIPSTDALYLLGDFNARVGADREAWPSCLGAYGRGKMNDNGQRLLEPVLLPWPVCHQHFLPMQGNPPGLLKTPTLSPLAPTGPSPNQTQRPCQRPPHPHLS